MPTIHKLNLTAHVAPKDGKRGPAGIRLGIEGSESTDGFSVYLRVPYPDTGKAERWSDVIGHTLSLDNAAAMAKAVNTPAATLRNEPGRGNVELDVTDTDFVMTGQDKSGHAVRQEGKVLTVVDWPPHQDLPIDEPARDGDQTVILHVSMLEKLFKATKALGGEGVELVLDSKGWLVDERGRQRSAPFQLRVLDHEGRELARGAGTPTIR